MFNGLAQNVYFVVWSCLLHSVPVVTIESLIINLCYAEGHVLLA